jgi:hypothetical protein
MYEPVPYKDRAHTEEEHELILRTLLANLDTASEAFRQWARGRFHIKGSGVSTATDSNLTNENRRLIKRNAELEKDYKRLSQDQGAMIRKDEAVKRARGQRNDIQDALTHFWHCKVGPSCSECLDYQEKHRLDDR